MTRNLLGATETARPVIAAVAIHDAMESLPWQEIHDLREQRLAEVHGDSWVTKSRTLEHIPLTFTHILHARNSWCIPVQ
jgi:hypothetical protein